MNRPPGERTHLPPSFQATLAKSGPVHSREEELAMALRWRDHGDRLARDELARAQLRNVLTLAIKYRHYGVPIPELVAEGNCGLVMALSKFDATRGVRFATYAAHWIRAHILSYVLHSRSLVSGPLRSQTFFKIRRERARLQAALSSNSEVEAALSDRMGMSPKRVRSVLERIDSRDVSLDAPATRESQTPLVDLLGCTRYDPEQSLAAARRGDDVGAAVGEALATLDRRERLIAECRLMASTEDQIPLAEIGRRLKVSRERARQLEARAKRKLRAALIRRHPSLGDERSNHAA